MLSDDVSECESSSRSECETLSELQVVSLSSLEWCLSYCWRIGDKSPVAHIPQHPAPQLEGRNSCIVTGLLACKLIVCGLITFCIQCRKFVCFMHLLYKMQKICEAILCLTCATCWVTLMSWGLHSCAKKHGCMQEEHIWSLSMHLSCVKRNALWLLYSKRWLV